MNEQINRLHEFALTDLFDITGSVTTPKNKLELVKVKDPLHAYPYVTTQAVNNGIAGYSNQFTEIGNVLTVDSAVLGICFYQAENFTASDHVEKLIPKFPMTEKLAVYFVAALNKIAVELGYSYQKKRSQTALRNERIFLPAIRMLVPDFDILNRLLCTPPALLEDGGVDMSKIDTSGWKEFRFGDVFTVEPTKKLTFPGVNYVMDKDIISANGTVPYVAAISTNNGVSGYSSYPANNDGDCITLSTTADSSNTVFYRKDPFIGRQQIAAIRRKDRLPIGENIGLFIVSVIKNITKQFNYGNKLTVDYLKNTTILLPCKEEYVPDWDYMQERIAELEKERIAELDAYLKVTGLDNSELTIEDEMVLEGFFDKNIVWKSVTMKDLGFCIYHGKRLIKTDRIRGAIPLITAGENNQGVADYIGNDRDVYKDAITVDMFGNSFLHDGLCSGDDNVYFFVNDEYDAREKEFIVAAIRKVTKGKYSYSNQFRQYDAESLTIKMPFLSDGSLAREYIYIYIYTSNGEEDNQESCAMAAKTNEYLEKCRVRYTNFKVEDFFTQRRGKESAPNQVMDGDIPMINEISINNGLSKYGTSSFILPGNAITVSVNYAKTCFYQPEKFIASVNILALYNSFLTEGSGLYVASILRKKHSQFDYAHKISKDRLKAEEVEFPATKDNTPNWIYMGKYLSAIEKLVIKDVIKWKDKEIETTKHLVG